MIFAKFTLHIVAVISFASCLQQSNQPPRINRTVDEIEARKEAKLLPNFSLGSFIPSVSKITLPKLPIPKRNTVTLTSTILTQTTKQVVVYPTCMRLHNIKSLCKGRVETILPTPSLSQMPSWKETDSDYDQEQVDRQAISPSSTQPIQMTEIKDSPRKNLIEPSELDYEYAAADDVTSSLPGNVGGTRKVGNFIEKYFGSKYEIVTEYFTATKVQLFTDYAHTATLLVLNCLPPEMEHTICDLEHLQPLLHLINARKNSTEIKNIVDKVYEHVNEFVLNNPYGLLGINSGQGENQAYGALNSDGFLSIVKSAEYFPIGTTYLLR